jgi:hypothetical protein
VIIDRSHKSWAVVSALVLALAVVSYVPYALGSVPPRGGSPVGLAYGIAGFAAMVVVTLLSLRKKFPIWRIGRTQAWMRAHLWLGALSLPLIVLHAGFLFGHGLTSVLMWLFAFVYASGFFGAYIQHTMPRRLMRDLPMETIYEQIGHVRPQLLDEGDTVVAGASSKLQVSVALREFYTREMRPFLERPTRAHPLADPILAAASFGKLRPLVPAALEGAVLDLENLCEEERQLLRQERMHRLLHGWLLVHVPLSFALMALAVVHIVMALRF